MGLRLSIPYLVTMTEYILTDKIRNVWAVNPAMGDYSYEQDGRGYLYSSSRRRQPSISSPWATMSTYGMVVWAP